MSAAAALSAAVESLDLTRPGMPARDSIVEVRQVSKPSAAAAEVAGGAAFRIIMTNEVDEYEKGRKPRRKVRKPSRTLAAKKAAAVPAGDRFDGTARKAAKISIADAPIKTYADLRTLINSLTPDQKMINRTPKISKGATSNRVEEEKRNIRLKCFLYAASREDDNDYHLILGRDRSKTPPEMYMTMELSGLPPENSPAFAKLKASRDAFKAFFASIGASLPGKKYQFYDPPRPVQIEGSLFFDVNHATGTRPGPPSLKSRMPTVWEVHPITKMVFNP